MKKKDDERLIVDGLSLPTRDKLRKYAGLLEEEMIGTTITEDPIEPFKFQTEAAEKFCEIFKLIRGDIGGTDADLRSIALAILQTNWASMSK